VKKSIVFLFLCISSISVYSQRYKILSGDLRNLSEIKEYYCTFDYTGMEVNGYESEEAFLKDKIEKRKKYDNGQDLKGKAAAFEKDWFEDRKNKYEPGFIGYFNEQLKDENVKITPNPDTKCTITIKTTWIYPGYEVANVEPAKISAIITVSETLNPSNVLLSISFEKSIGVVKDYRGQGDRIKGAYEKLAKNLTLQMKRFL
jgi:hypothetical protein